MVGPVSELAQGARRLAAAARRLLFQRLFFTLSLLLGVMQVVLGHWVIVVLADRPGPGWFVGGLLAVLLITANGLLVPTPTLM